MLGKKVCSWANDSERLTPLRTLSRIRPSAAWSSLCLSSSATMPSAPSSVCPAPIRVASSRVICDTCLPALVLRARCCPAPAFARTGEVSIGMSPFSWRRTIAVRESAASSSPATRSPPTVSARYAKVGKGLPALRHPALLLEGGGAGEALLQAVGEHGPHAGLDRGGLDRLGRRPVPDQVADGLVGLEELEDRDAADEAGALALLATDRPVELAGGRRLEAGAVEEAALLRGQRVRRPAGGAEHADEALAHHAA